MYNNVGLKSARGSGTNCYVQRNVASVKSLRSHALPYGEQKKREAAAEKKVVVHRRANKEILEHEEKRKVEVELIDWAEKEGILDAERTEEVEELMNRKREEIANDRRRRIEQEEVERPVSTHRELELKEVQQKRFGDAVGVSRNYVEGQGLDPERRKRRDKEYDRLEVERLKREEEKILLRLEELKRESSSRGDLHRGDSSPRGHADYNKRYRYYDRCYSERGSPDDERSRYYSQTRKRSHKRFRHLSPERRDLEYSSRWRGSRRSVSRSPSVNGDYDGGGRERSDFADGERRTVCKRSSPSRWGGRTRSASSSSSWSSSSAESPKKHKYK